MKPSPRADYNCNVLWLLLSWGSCLIDDIVRTMHHKSSRTRDSHLLDATEQDKDPRRRAGELGLVLIALAVVNHMLHSTFEDHTQWQVLPEGKPGLAVAAEARPKANHEASP